MYDIDTDQLDLHRGPHQIREFTRAASPCPPNRRTSPNKMNFLDGTLDKPLYRNLLPLPWLAQSAFRMFVQPVSDYVAAAPILE